MVILSAQRRLEEKTDSKDHPQRLPTGSEDKGLIDNSISMPCYVDCNQLSGASL